MNAVPDLSKVLEWSKYCDTNEQENLEEISSLYQEASAFLEHYTWCLEIKESFVGMFYPGIVAIFLFKITPSRPEVDEWIWVLVGDIPPAYLTIEECPNPACALDGYIGAMQEWVEAVNSDQSVAKLIPVNVPATKEYAEALASRLNFLNERILSEYQDDLDA